MEKYLRDYEMVRKELKIISIWSHKSYTININFFKVIIELLVQQESNLGDLDFFWASDRASSYILVKKMGRSHQLEWPLSKGKETTSVVF